MKHLLGLSSIVFLFFLALLPRVSAAAPGTYVELYWPLDESYNFDIDLKVTNTPESDTGLFWSHQFAFVGGSGGYLGLQIVGSGKKAIFSIWDAVGGNPDKIGDTSPPETFNGCRIFTGEGTGWQCLISYDWKIGVNYRLRLWAAGIQTSGNEWWVAAVNDYSANSETVIGHIQVPASFGWLGSWSVTWVEYFIYSTCDVPYTRAVFSYPFARNAAGDRAPEKAKAAYGTSPCKNSNIEYLGNGAYAIEAGQKVQRTTPDETWLWAQEPTLLQQPVPEFPSASVLVASLLLIFVILKRRHAQTRRPAMIYRWPSSLVLISL